MLAGALILNSSSAKTILIWFAANSSTIKALGGFLIFNRFYGIAQLKLYQMFYAMYVKEHASYRSMIVRWASSEPSPKPAAMTV